MLDKHGVSDKEFARYQGKLGPEQRAQEKAAAQALDRQAASAKTQPAPDPNAAKPADQIVIQRGGNATQAIDPKTGAPLPEVDRPMPTVERGHAGSPKVKSTRSSHRAKSRSHRRVRHHR